MCQWYNCMVGCVGLTLFLTKIAALFTYAVNHATCKTVANKGISFLMWFSDPTPLHMALIIHRLHTQRAFGESNSLTPCLGCTLLSQFSASTSFLCATFWVESFDLVVPQYETVTPRYRNPRHFCRQTDILRISTAVCIAVTLMHSKQ